MGKEERRKRRKGSIAWLLAMAFVARLFSEVAKALAQKKEEEERREERRKEEEMFCFKQKNNLEAGLKVVFFLESCYQEFTRRLKKIELDDLSRKKKKKGKRTKEER